MHEYDLMAKLKIMTTEKKLFSIKSKWIMCWPNATSSCRRLIEKIELFEGRPGKRANKNRFCCCSNAKNERQLTEIENLFVQRVSFLLIFFVFISYLCVIVWCWRRLKMTPHSSENVAFDESTCLAIASTSFSLFSLIFIDLHRLSCCRHLH